MNKLLYAAAAAAGLLAVAWVAVGYAGTHGVALSVTLLIAAAYGAGAFELHRFRRATAALDAALHALSQPPAALQEWLDTLPAPLRRAVQARVEGQRVALPAPALTPYLVGLLVLLGMLGTFLGMVVTLNGTVSALEGSTELQSMRAALAAPVKGLGVAFGTSVAGVCASAMLGLMSALSRRDRLLATQRLDECIAGPLRAHSLAQQRAQGLQALQAQALQLPQLVERLDAMMARLQQHHDESASRWLAGQAQFQREALATHAELAASVGRALQHSLDEGARRATATLEPFARETLGAMARNAGALQANVVTTLGAQVEALLAGLTQNVAAVSSQLEARQAALVGALQAQFEARSGALAQALEERHASLLAEQASRHAGWVAGQEERNAALLAAQEERQARLLATQEQRHAERWAAWGQAEAQRAAQWQTGLAETTAALRQGWQAAAAEVHGQQQAICRTLETTAGSLVAQARDDARATLAEVARLADEASQAPRLAAEVLARMQQQVSDGLARDAAALDERQRLMAALAALLQALEQQSQAQQAATEALLARSAALVDTAQARIDHTVAESAAALGEAAAQVAGSAAETTALGEAFGLAVQRFGDSGERLALQLQRVEEALDKATARSDEQLGYYVAQARELIDLTLLSQKQIVEEMRRLAPASPALAEEAP